MNATTTADHSLAIARIRRDTYRAARAMGNSTPESQRAARITVEHVRANPSKLPATREELDRVLNELGIAPQGRREVRWERAS